MPGSRPLSPAERAYIAAARDKAHTLYEGRTVAHRSCGAALAETFSLATPAYQALRRGGITGRGACGAIRAGEQVLGELLGDPDPAGPVTDELRAAVTWYQRAWAERLDLGPGAGPPPAPGAAPDVTCNNLTRPLGDFAGPARRGFCTQLAADVAGLVAEALVRFGRFVPGKLELSIAPIARTEDPT